MHRLLTALVMTIGLSLYSLWIGPDALAGDATSFNPVPIQVVAKSSGGVPVGTIIAWPVATNPSDWDKWLECNGQAVNAAVYPELAAIVGANVPNYQGLFLRGYGDQASYHYGAVTHSSAALGALQGDAVRGVTGSISFHHAGSGGSSGVFYGSSWSGVSPVSGGGGGYYSANFDISRSVPVHNEIRPVNKSVRYLIRALP